MKSNKYFVGLGVFLLLLLICCLYGNVYANGQPSVISVDPSATTVTVGQDFTVDVVLTYAANLYAFQFSLGFDKTKLMATGIDDGGYLNAPTIELAKIIDNVVGFVTYSRTSVLPALPKTGGSPPPLATIHFKALATGNSNLYLYNTILNDNNGLELDHTTSDGEATIEAGAAPVGGAWEPIDMFGLLAPWIGLAAAIGASGALFGLTKRYIKRKIS